jgi:hypothetical protein
MTNLELNTIDLPSSGSFSTSIPLTFPRLSFGELLSLSSRYPQSGNPLEIFLYEYEELVFKKNIYSSQLKVIDVIPYISLIKIHQLYDSEDSFTVSSICPIDGEIVTIKKPIMDFLNCELTSMSMDLLGSRNSVPLKDKEIMIKPKTVAEMEPIFGQLKKNKLLDLKLYALLSVFDIDLKDVMNMRELKDIKIFSTIYQNITTFVHYNNFECTEGHSWRVPIDLTRAVGDPFRYISENDYPFGFSL